MSRSRIGWSIPGGVLLLVVGVVIGTLISSAGATAAPDGAAVAPDAAATPVPQEQQAYEFTDDPEILRQVATGGMPLGRWKEGLMFEGIEPMPWLKSAANWYPGTEELQPDEMRIIFMGTSPTIRPGQMNTSIYVELGNGNTFVFEIGEGSVANYLASGIPLNQINDIFLSHLHIDHFGSLPYVYMFGGWAGRWHENLRLYGPSGRTPEFGTAAMVEGMKQMLAWHIDAFSIFPTGTNWNVDVTEFPFDDAGGTVYDKQGVKVIHWPASHAKDGASGYRLDWEETGMSFCFTGDTRPNTLDIEFCEGVDVMVSEMQPEVVAISSGVQGVPPFVGRYTIDTHHTPAYAAGYIFDQVQPRIALTTHMPFDPYINAEAVAEVREHWKGPYHFGAPDMVVVNVTPDQIWVRDATPTTLRSNSTSRPAASWCRPRSTPERTFRASSSGTTRLPPSCTTQKAFTPSCFSSGRRATRPCGFRWKACLRTWSRA